MTDFKNFLRKVLNDFEFHYTDSDSLEALVEELEGWDEPGVDFLLKTVKDVLDQHLFQRQLLTPRQVNRIRNALKALIKEPNDSGVSQQMTILEEMEDPSRLTSPVEKELILPLTQELVEKLQKDVLSSTLTNYVLEYLEVVNQLESPIIEKIERILGRHGWNPRGGFDREVNRKELVKDLSQILN